MAPNPLNLQSVLLQNIEPISKRNHSSLYSKVLKLIVTNDLTKENDPSPFIQTDPRYEQKEEFQKDTYKLFTSLKSFNYISTDKFETKDEKGRPKYNTLELIPKLLSRITNYKVSIGKQFENSIYKVDFWQIYKNGAWLTESEVKKFYTDPLNISYMDNLFIDKLAKTFEETSRNLEGNLSFKFSRFDLLNLEYRYKLFSGPEVAAFAKGADILKEPKFKIKDLIYPKNQVGAATTTPTDIYNEKDLKFFLIFEFVMDETDDEANKASYNHPFYDLMKNPVILECVIYKHEFDLPSYFKDRNVKEDSFTYTLKTYFTSFIEAASKNPTFGSMYDIFAAFDNNYTEEVEKRKNTFIDAQKLYIQQCRSAASNPVLLKTAKETYFQSVQTASSDLDRYYTTASNDFNKKFDNFINSFSNVIGIGTGSLKEIGGLTYAIKPQDIIGAVPPNDIVFFGSEVEARNSGGIGSVGTITVVRAPGTQKIYTVPDASIIKEGDKSYFSISYVYFGDLLESLFPKEDINTCGDAYFIIQDPLPTPIRRTAIVNIADIPISVSLLRKIKKEFLDDRIKNKENGFSSIAFMDSVINNLQIASNQYFGIGYNGNISDLSILHSTTINPINICKTTNKKYEDNILKATTKYDSFKNPVREKFETNPQNLNSRGTKLLKREDISPYLKLLSEQSLEATKNPSLSKRTYNHIWYSPTKKFLAKDILTDYSKSGYIPKVKDIPDSSFFKYFNIQSDQNYRASFLNWLREEIGMHGFSVEPIMGGYIDALAPDNKTIKDQYTGPIKRMDMQPAIKTMSLERMDMEHLREAQITSDTYKGFVRLPYKAKIEFYSPFFNIFENGDYIYLIPPVMFRYTDDILATLTYEQLKEEFILNMNSIGIGGIYMIHSINVNLKTFLPALSNNKNNYSFIIDIVNSSCNIEATFVSFGDGTPTITQASPMTDNCLAIPTQGT